MIKWLKYYKLSRYHKQNHSGYDIFTLSKPECKPEMQEEDGPYFLNFKRKSHFCNGFPENTNCKNIVFTLDDLLISQCYVHY